MSSHPILKKRYGFIFIALSSLSLYLQSPLHSQESKRKGPPCKNCFSVNFNDVDIHDWLKTMASLIRKNILVDDSIKGKITVISYQKIPERRALAFMKQVLELKGYGIIEEPNLLKIVNLKKASDASLLADEKIDFKSAGVVSRMLTLPSNVDANEILNIFKSVAGGNVTVIPYLPTNTLIVTGFARNVLRSMRIVKKLIEEIEAAGSLSSSAQVHIYHARHITADSLAGVLTKLDAPEIRGSGEVKRPKSKTNKKIRAVAHKESNSLVVTAAPGEWIGIESIIKKLDVPRTQILLEVLIAEISSDKSNDFGVDWRVFSSDEPHAQFNTDIAIDSNIIDPSADPNSNQFLNARRNTLNGFSLGFIGNDGDLLGILKANVTRQNFNVLSSPQVLALNNQEAEINVGQDVPVRTRSQGSSEGSTITESFEYKPAGIKLKVTPQINPSGQITLNFFAEISSIQGQDAAASGSNPTFSKRNIKTYATVLDKQTIVLGGLISSENTKTITKVPLLGDIPLLGYLFRRTIDSNVRRNLMIFMTPHVLKGRKQADKITELKRGEQGESLKKLHNDVIVWPEKSLKDK